MTALVVKSHYSFPLNATTTGITTGTVKRLYVGEWSLRFLEGLLALLLMFSVCLSSYKYPIFARDPAPLASLTTFLVNSHSLESVLTRGGDNLNERPDRPSLGNMFFYSFEDGIKPPSRLPHTLSMAFYRDEDTSSSSTYSKTDHHNDLDWWQPMAATWAYRTVILVCTVLLVISLEVSFYFSTKNNGISSISSESNARYAWTYLPSLIMAGISLGYGSLDSMARMLHLFQKLHREELSFQEMLREPLGSFTIQAMVQSMRLSHLALSVVLFTSLLAPALTIITSGLF